ncbi:thiamine pyrophosphate-dependent enzyme [Roseiarcaceae bacterium H3SJ34-1]|uniref:thiamine pyrophosphate-dependent enzyme n=1 Tax=Terripilifer ovatus TaxID=3032367 RepID=UPI003AB95D4A|nr:thiamine pyrophosphate-dependent enzyme [Roseiarcaceae bacterium H3SJ34-1]
MLDRMKCLGLFRERITEEIVVATYSTATDWLAISDRPLNYFSFGAMGLASSHGLGLAIAHPGRRVLVFDGDGSLLMNLGALVTTTAVAPHNFVHIVWHNGTYEANGGHPLPSTSVRFADLALAAGYRKTMHISDMPTFESSLDAILSESGPLFVELIVEQGQLGPRSYADMYSAKRREAFRQALNPPSDGSRFAGPLQ